MSANKAQNDAHSLTRDAEYTKILADNLMSGVSILDEDMNYLFISESTYENLDLDKGKLRPGDSLSKCHELMIENGLLTPDLLTAMKLSPDDQIKRNKLGVQTNSRLVPCGKTISIADNVSDLVKTDKLLEKALTLGEAGYWSLDIPTKTYTISKSLYAFFGADVGHKLEKQGIISVIHPEDRAKFKEALTNAPKTGNRFEITCRAQTYKGSFRWSNITGEIIRDLKGKAIRMEAFVKDVTRQRKQSNALERAKDEAIAASQAKSEFLANMSHEIRTPMNGILGMAELLSNSEIDERQKEFVSVINNSASALLTIINDILDFSKIEAGAFEMDPVPFDLKSSINDVTSLLRTKAQEKNLEMIINYPAEFPKNFIGDAGRLRQVITNLLGNAVKFTETGHIQIDVDIKPTRDMAICTVDVKDSGIGISP